MKKILLAALCIALAAPAIAVDTKVNGFFRNKMYWYEASRGKDIQDHQFTDQRFRAKITMDLNEYVSVVYYGEVDFTWGDAAYGAGVAVVEDVNGKTQVIRKQNRNVGGGAGGDTVNIETKNLYTVIKIPETPVAATLGLQTYVDSFSQVVFLSDMAGGKVAGKFGMVSGNLAYFIMQEGATNVDDDISLLSLQSNFALSETLNLGFDAYWVNLNGAVDGNTGLAGIIEASGTDSADLFFVGPQVEWKTDMFTLSGWFLYEGGTADVPGAAEDEVDVSAFAASAKVAAKLAGFNLGLRGMYLSSDEDRTDDKYEGLATVQTGEVAPFGDSGMMIMIGDPFTTTQVIGLYNGRAMDDAAYAGYGMYGATVTADFVPPAMQDLYFKAAVGTFWSLEEDRGGDQVDDKEGKHLGEEFALRAGIKIAKVVDFSLNGAYALWGSFYDNTVDKTTGLPASKSLASNGDDPDNSWLTYAMVNVGF